MPFRSLVESGEKQARNFRKPKYRVTVLGCANASGTCKLPLAFTHKSAGAEEDAPVSEAR